MTHIDVVNNKSKQKSKKKKTSNLAMLTYKCIQEKYNCQQNKVTTYNFDHCICITFSSNVAT